MAATFMSRESIAGGESAGGHNGVWLGAAVGTAGTVETSGSLPCGADVHCSALSAASVASASSPSAVNASRSMLYVEEISVGCLTAASSRIERASLWTSIARPWLPWSAYKAPNSSSVSATRLSRGPNSSRCIVTAFLNESMPLSNSVWRRYMLPRRRYASATASLFSARIVVQIFRAAPYAFTARGKSPCFVYDAARIACAVATLV
mmetsp:Transcript_27398/g.71901  ORF Transcript_27398/g.71901 Transcript_27398/m.71901 type:complete len:207 (+) Transcript_27398:602-1222(+)